MKEIKYYHLRRNLTDEKPLDFVSLDNAYAFLTTFFAQKNVQLWHCDGIEDSAEPTPKDFVEKVIAECGTVEFEIVADGEHYDLWIFEKELRLMDDGQISPWFNRFCPDIKPGINDFDRELVENYYVRAAQGDASCQNNIGLLYSGDRILKQDDMKALRYFKLAADQGHADALENYFLLLESLYCEAKNKMS